MQIPDTAQVLIESELKKLAESNKYSVPSHKRIEIYVALGPSNVNDDKILDEAHQNSAFPVLSTADRVRAQITITTAKKVLPLWELACQESELYFTEQDWQDKAEDQSKEEGYLHKRKTLPIEKFSAYDVPRAFIPLHIIEMAESALTGNVHDYVSFQHQASEWWGFYGRPEKMEREFLIKWAAEEAIETAIGSNKDSPDPPAENAFYAFAGTFTGNGLREGAYTLDENKQHEFWVWWLSKAVPLAFESVS